MEPILFSFFLIVCSRGLSSGPFSSIKRYFSRAPQAMASPQDKNYRRVPLLDHEIHGALAPRSTARMPNIARTIQVIRNVQHVPIGLRICNACGTTKLYACAPVACYADGLWAHVMSGELLFRLMVLYPRNIQDYSGNLFCFARRLG